MSKCRRDANMTDAACKNIGEFSICCHGGAGDISRDVDKDQFYSPLAFILEKVYIFARENLENENVQAVDVAEYAVQLFEDSEVFNAGRGAVMTADSTFELEASIMDGSTGKCGAAVMLKRAKNPISIARMIMDETPHCCLVGESAEKLACMKGHEMVEQEYYFTKRRHAQLRSSQEENVIVNDHNLLKATGTQDDDTFAKCSNDVPINSKFGTVGCVCYFKGHLAAATSTGGMTNKLSGRVGDSAIIGSGTFADDRTCAVSCTGKGEIFIQNVVAHAVSARMSLSGMTLDQACSEVVHSILPEDSGGLIAVDNEGKISMEFNTKGMMRLTCNNEGVGSISIWEESVEIRCPLDAS